MREPIEARKNRNMHIDWGRSSCSTLLQYFAAWNLKWSSLPDSWRLSPGEWHSCGVVWGIGMMILGLFKKQRFSGCCGPRLKTTKPLQSIISHMRTGGGSNHLPTDIVKFLSSYFIQNLSCCSVNADCSCFTVKALLANHLKALNEVHPYLPFLYTFMSLDQF